MRELPLADCLPRVLPDGWRKLDDWGDGYGVQHRSGLKVLISTAPYDGTDWIHLSCSRHDRIPSWDDLKFAKQTFLGDKRAAVQVLPPADQYVNIHPFVLHLFALVDGELPLPDFTNGTKSL